MGIHDGISSLLIHIYGLKSYLTNYSLHIISTTEKLAKDFLNGVGKQLHKELATQDQINKHTSYMTGEAGNLILSFTLYGLTKVFLCQ